MAIDPALVQLYMARMNAQQNQQNLQGNRQDERLRLQLLLQQMKGQASAQAEAKAANEGRYNTILDRDLDTRNRLLDYVSQYGQSTLDDVERENKRARGADTANLAAAGFLGASPDRMRGADVVNTRSYLENLNRAKDGLLRNAISVDERATNRLSDFQERRVDAYPENTPFPAAALGAMSGGYTGGGVVGGNGGYGGGAGGMDWLLQMLLNSGTAGKRVGMGGGGRRALQAMRGAPQPAVDPNTLVPYLQAGHTAAGDAQQRGQDSLAQQNAMVGLAQAMRSGGLEGNDAVNRNLDYLQQMGMAQKNYAPGVPEINFFPTERQVRYEESATPAKTTAAAATPAATTYQQPRLSIEELKKIRSNRTGSKATLSNSRRNAYLARKAPAGGSPYQSPYFDPRTDYIGG